MDKEIEVWCSLHSDELIDSLVSLDYDDLLLFIKNLDLRIADLDFTIEVYKHFRDEIIKEGVDPVTGELNYELEALNTNLLFSDKE